MDYDTVLLKLQEVECELANKNRLIERYENELARERVDNVRLEDKLKILSLESEKQLRDAVAVHHALVEQLAEFEKFIGPVLAQMQNELNKTKERCAEMEARLKDESAEKCGDLAQRLLEAEKKLADTSKLVDGYEKDLSQERVDRIRLEDKLSVLNLESTKRIEAATNMNKLLADQLAEIEKSTGAILEQLNHELRKAIDKYAKLELKYCDLNRKYDRLLAEFHVKEMRF